jgi:pyruvate dehydrogenase E2 component (dihydrolipoamide acetyltransferase)
MPEVLANATEAAIQGWLVNEGDTITVGQPLAEIETEKAMVEYNAEVGGVLVKLLVQPGDSVDVGAPIGVIADSSEGDIDIDKLLAGEGGAAAAPTAAATPTPIPAEAAASSDATPTTPDDQSAVFESEDAHAEAEGSLPSAPSGTDDAAVASSVAESQTDAASDTSSSASSASSTSSSSTSSSASSSPAQGEGGARQFASPLVRRLARERSLDLASVQGSGPGGRIVRRDVENLTAPEPAKAPAAEPAAAPKPAPTASVSASGAGFTEVPHTGMRKAIARRLTESKSTVPHFYLVADVRVDKLLELRAQVNQAASRKISVNDFVVKAVAFALTDVPEANAIWTDTATRRFDSVDLAVAVSTDGGLLTPVLRGVEKLSLTSISEQIADLATRARAGKLKQNELEGGSFSVSNLGMYGVDEFSAILNPPQSGILAVGAAKQRAVVIDGELAVGTVMTVTLSADHRVVDGAVGAEWLAAFVKRVENPLSLLI